jgi:hypothetical protein
MFRRVFHETLAVAGEAEPAAGAAGDAEQQQPVGAGGEGAGGAGGRAAAPLPARFIEFALHSKVRPAAGPGSSRVPSVSGGPPRGG